jgi:hypothetical protein
MDMIAHYENAQEAYLFQGFAGNPYAQLWADLADSIPALNLTGHLELGGGSSDHIPFRNFGYNSIFLHEFVFSTVYHSYMDSTTYLNFDYMTRMTKTTLATSYVADQQFIPDYALNMTTVEEFPILLYPNQPTPVEIIVREYGGAQIIPGSVLLHYSVNGGEELTESMSEVGDDVFSGSLPAFDCNDGVIYYFSAEDDSLGVIYYPGLNETILATAATGLSTVFEDYFGIDQGWTVITDAMQGEWEHVEGRYDYDGNRFYYYAGGFSAVHNGLSSLLSPPIEIDGEDCIFEYARWCANRNEPGPQIDSIHVKISPNGTMWIPVEKLAATDGVAREWKLVEFRVSDFFAPPQTVWLKFDVIEYGDDAFVSAAVDAVRFIGFSTDLNITTAKIPSWTAGHFLSIQLEAAACDTGVLTWTDRFGQLEGTGLSLSTDGLLSGIPSKLGSIVFRALVIDQLGEFDEKIFSFIIYNYLIITTDGIHTATLNEFYTCQLNSNGGTGEKIWSDRDGDLVGTGIVLSPDGLLSGTPPTEGEYTFTARVTDEVDAFADRQFTLRILPPYSCGDANGDEQINIADAVFLISYVFKGGPAPYPLEAGDANCDDEVNVGDAVHLINYVFKGGTDPCCP